MTHTTAPADEPYEESADYSWTERAFQMLESDHLHGEVISREGIIRSRVWGPCPRCGHPLDDQQTHSAVTSLMGWRNDTRTADPGQPASDADAAYFQVDVSCGCGTSHPGAPETQAGCGVNFRVELPLHPAEIGGQP